MIKRFIPYICILMILVGCTSTPTVSAAAQSDSPQVSIYKERSIRAQGMVVLARQIDLSFPLTGHVIEVLPKEGDSVKIGEVVARLDATELKAAVLSAQADLAVAQAKLQQELSAPRKADVDRAKAEIVAAGAVHIFSDYEATAVAANVAAAQARLDNLLAQPYPEDVKVAQAEVERAQVDVERAQEHLEQANLISPINGSVIRVNMYPGENVYSGQSVLTIANPQDLRVEAKVTDRDVTEIYPGQEALVSFSGLPGVTVKGTVFNIVPDESKDKTGQFWIYLQLAELPVGVRWGLPVDVTINTGQ